MFSAKENIEETNAIQCHLMFFGPKLNFSTFRIIKMFDAILCFAINSFYRAHTLQVHAFSIRSSLKRPREM